MKSKLLLLVVCCLAVASAADSLAAAAPLRPRAEVYALEGLGVLPGAACCGCLGYGFAFAAFLIDWDNDNPGLANQGWVAFVGSLALVSVAAAPAAAGYGTARVGRAIGESGSTGWAIGGAYAGLPLAIGGVALGSFVGNSPGHGDQSPWRYPIYVLAGLAVPTGAVVGYNLGAPSNSVGSRFQPPALAMTGVERPDHSVEYGVKVQLAGLRF
jgi:hypothetical protein